MLACGAAVADWIAVSSTSPTLARLELVAKPLVPFALVGVAITSTGPSLGAQLLLVAALLACCAGDVALMLDGPDRPFFLPGLGAFLVGQLLFAATFAIGADGRFLTGLVIVAVLFTGPMTLVIRRVAAEHRSLLGPISVYIIAIVLMASLAVAYGFEPGLRPKAALAGGLLFVASDALLAINRFVRPFKHSTVAVHATYHLAIIGLTIGVMTPG